jgi:outer membrane protein
MRSLIRATSLALALVTTGAGAAAAQGPASPLKIAYINSQQILAQAPGRAEAEAQFEREMNGYRQAVQRMGDSLNTMIAAYNKEEVSLSPAAKESRQKAIREKEDAYQKKTQELQQQAQQRQVELVEPIMQQINQIIAQLRNEGGYAMIFDAGSNAGVLVAADTSLNITDKVIARLKTAGPPKPVSAATPAKPSAAPPGISIGAPANAPAGVSRPKTPPRQ